MKESQNRLLKISLWVAIILFVLRCVISWKSIIAEFSLYNLFGYAGEAIAITTVFSIFYERFL